MKKRGQLVFIAIITLVVALVVALVYPKIAKTYATGEIALKTAAARDIALIIDAIYAYPYDMEITYDYDLSGFVVEISQNRVKIYDTSFVTVHEGIIQGIDPVYTQYSFTPINDNPDFILDRPKKIIFEKENGKIKCKYQKESAIMTCQ